MKGGSLALRDPALAAIMGVGGFGSDFGRERGLPGSNFGRDYSFGADDGASLHPAEAKAIIAQHLKKQAHTKSRMQILEPNAESEVKVQRYFLALVFVAATGASAPALTLGTASAIAGSVVPTTRFRPQRVTVNAPEPEFINLNQIQIANVNAITSGTVDAFDLNANAVDATLDLPTIEPGIPVSSAGAYTGDTAGRTAATAYTARMSFRGPSNVAG